MARPPLTKLRRPHTLLKRAGFTILEMMVAVSILAMSAAVLLGTQATGMQMTAYSNDLSIIVMLTRSKMQDIKYGLLQESFDSEGDEVDETISGDFGNEGHPEINWTAVIKGVEIEDDAANDMVETMESQLFGSEESSGSLEGVAIGSSIPLIISLMPQIINDLGKRIRHIELTVTWEHLGEEQSMTVSQFIVQLVDPETLIDGNSIDGNANSGATNPTGGGKGGKGGTSFGKKGKGGAAGGNKGGFGRKGK